MSKELVVMGAMVPERTKIVETLDLIESKAMESDDPALHMKAINQYRLIEMRAGQIKASDLKRLAHRKELVMFRVMGEQIKSRAKELTLDKIGITKHDSQMAQWIHGLPKYAYDYMLKKSSPTVASTFTLAKKYFKFVELCVKYGVNGQDRTALIKKHVTKRTTARDFTDILEKIIQEAEGGITVDDDEMDIEVLMTTDLKLTVNACHTVVKRLAKVEETMAVATYYVDDDLKLLANISSILNTVNERVIEIHAEIEEAFEKADENSGECSLKVGEIPEGD